MALEYVSQDMILVTTSLINGNGMINLKKLLLIFCFLSFQAMSEEKIIETELQTHEIVEFCFKSLSHPNCNLSSLDTRWVNIITVHHDTQILLNKLDTPDAATLQPILNANVKYIYDSVLHSYDNYISLSDGTVLDLGKKKAPRAIVGADVLVLIKRNGSHLIYWDGNTYDFENLKVTDQNIGVPGIFTTVTSKRNKGSMLETENGLILFFSRFDQFDTNWWTPPYEVLIDPNSLNMWTLPNIKKVMIGSIEQR